MTLSHFWRAAQDPERVMQIDISHWQGNDQHHRTELVTVEEPLEIRINGQSLAIVMRTPGHDAELAMGFLFSEGVIHDAAQVLRIENALDEDGLPLVNVLNIQLSQLSSNGHPGFERHFAVSSSCGLCGKQSISDLLLATSPLEPDALQLPIALFYTLADRLREQQTVFTATGGLHAAGLFGLNGELQLVREDIGRHNAVDKLVGYGLLQHIQPYREHILLVSGRTSFEILQKALLARIPCVVAISAPSSLAIELAEKSGITLLGFLRERSLNVYTHPERLI
ncbi:formate dehydrogenase accessory sulfurtransferase FdhD [Tengunoibacter tsumagoiensis]|uniref:Sulfur carrier protein FdhD n=1 Tax=Tengunoibacter tsumagoiensis TaxID=2014871 RepID=A0A401ZWT2_9CHLR|nr:formate dehydrogenase accessory sulfurtransferase FdhD [Tengunoibacter tsumagoiensis]GCE11266.1 sulfurtransferase FdhD [Tengunoibacter tsumagoiensis]